MGGNARCRCSCTIAPSRHHDNALRFAALTPTHAQPHTFHAAFTSAFAVMSASTQSAWPFCAAIKIGDAPVWTSQWRGETEGGGGEEKREERRGEADGTGGGGMDHRQSEDFDRSGMLIM